jgi:uncharacterized protein (TIGR03067 family)
MMKQFSATAVLTLLTAGLSAQSATPKALDGLQGTWVLTSINGQDLAGSGASMTLVFAADKYSQTVNGEVNERGTIKLGEDKKPMTIDLIITEGSDANKTQLGLIEITGNTMKLKLAVPGATDRPTDFAPAPEAGYLLAIATKKEAASRD